VFGRGSEGSVKRRKRSDDSFGIPPGLTYAVLDDTNLIRKNVMRTLRADPVHCSDASFARGDNHRECDNFALEIVAQQVDVAIFDQNLDVLDSRGGEYSVKGSEIAKQARELGYRGAAVLHTADNFSNVAQEEGVFDGYVSKAASKRTFLEGLSQAWANHIKHGKRMVRGDPQW
jgi:hypothetical protein